MAIAKSWMPPVLPRLLHALIALLAFVLAGGYAQAEASPSSSFSAEHMSARTDIKSLALHDPDNRLRTLTEFRGSVVLVYFGFTYCPDICPTELARLAELRRLLGNDGGRVQVVLITLDPERDTADILRDYATAFDPTFIALRGTLRETAAAARMFSVVWQKVKGSSPERYTIDHSVYVYALDPKTRLRLRFNPAIRIEQMRDDIRLLLSGK
jgi:protein SCO1/2